MNDTQTSTTALTDTPTTTKRTRSHFARRKEPQDVDVRNFLDGSDSGSADPRDSTDDDYTQDQEDQENDTTKETMKDTQTSTTALAGTPTTTKRTRSDFARCHDQDDAYNQMQLETNTIKNAWRHGQYTWFAQNCAFPPTNEVQLDNMATVPSDNEEEDDETLTEATVTENDQQPSPDSSVAIAQLVDESSLTDGNLTENDRQPSPGTSVALAQLLDKSSDEEERADTARLFGK